MRLINTYTGDFENFNDSDTPRYAILSHTWNPEGEQPYQDVRRIQEAHRTSSRVISESSHQLPLQLATPASVPPPNDLDVVRHGSTCGNPVSDLMSESTESSSDLLAGARTHRKDTPLPPTPASVPALSGIWDPLWGLSEKTRKACEVARRAGYRYIWIDSSCIDKTSSSELSEAINSMYNWYRGAQICYAFLSDVPGDDSVDDVKATGPGSRFRASRWFTRGWTLQELIGPRFIVFLSKEWWFLGTKDALADIVCDITGIEPGILLHKTPLSRASVAQRMSWAASRETTRVEDQAYCLLGIFGINMPTLYGEREQAFRRLQEEILRRIPDQSLFAWGNVASQLQELRHFSKYSGYSLDVRSVSSTSRSFFAPSPEAFLGCNNIVLAPSSATANLPPPALEFSATPYGLRMPFRLLSLREVGFKMNPASAGTDWCVAILGCSRVGDGPGTFLARVCYTSAHDAESNVSLLVPAMIGIPRPSSEHPYHTFDVHMWAVSLTDMDRRWRKRSVVKTVYLSHQDEATPKLPPNDDLSFFTLVLSERCRAILERDHGYAVSDVQGPTEDRPDSHTLTLSKDSFSIHIEYLHMRIREGSKDVFVTARIWILSSHEVPVFRETVSATTPFAAATWEIDMDRPLRIPMRNVGHIGSSPSGDNVMLKLGFDLMVPYRLYSINVTTTHTPPAGPVIPMRRQLQVPHKHIKMSLLGCVRKALESKGYAIRFEGPGEGDDDSDPTTHILTISNAAFTIVVQFMHYLCDTGEGSDQELAVVARVWLDSALGTYQDGPYALPWFSYRRKESALLGWEWRLDEGQIALTSPSGDPLTVCLGLDLAWQSEYYIRVDVVPERRAFHRPALPRLSVVYASMLRAGRQSKSLNLILPGHVRRALHASGFTVHFQGPTRSEDLFAQYVLTLSTPVLTITVKYSHAFVTADGSDRRGLQADAALTCTPSGPSDDPLAEAPHGYRYGALPLHWNDHPIPKWNLGPKETKLVPPTGGLPVTVRLDFDVLWSNEYGLVVEVTIPAPAPVPLNGDPELPGAMAQTPESMVPVDDLLPEILDRSGSVGEVALEGKPAMTGGGETRTRLPKTLRKVVRWRGMRRLFGLL